MRMQLRISRILEYPQISQSMKREVPELGGSQGGFIALVVSLVIIIIFACGAIYWLLRNHEQTDEERAARRRRNNIHSSSSFRYQASSTPSKTWLSNPFKGKRGKSSGTGSSRNIDRSGGWVRAGDEWDSDSGDEALFRPEIGRQLNPGSGHSVIPMEYSTPRDEPFRPPIDFPSPDTPPGVRFNLNTPYDAPTQRSTMTADNQPSTVSILQRSFSPEPIPGSSSDVPIPHENRKESDSSVRTFTGGTKFVEAL